MIASFLETTTGYLGSVNGVSKWYLRRARHGGFDIYEIVCQPDCCRLRAAASTLTRAKAYVYTREMGR